MIHLRPVREAIEKARIETTKRLRDEIEEMRISRELVDKHNRRVRASAEYRQNGAP